LCILKKSRKAALINIDAVLWAYNGTPVNYLSKNINSTSWAGFSEANLLKYLNSKCPYHYPIILLKIGRPDFMIEPF